MWRRYSWLILLTTAVMALVAFRKPAERYFDVAKSLDIFATLFKEVNAYYVDEIEPQKLIRKGIDGMLESLDPYTDYIPEDEIESFRISTTGQYGGVGALIGIINKRTIITFPYKDFPAYLAGVKVGDEIVSVDGHLVKGKTTSEVSAWMKGKPKTEVEIRVHRYGLKDDLVFKIRREKIAVSNLAYTGLVEPSIGYIRLDDFTPGASRELGEALTALKAQGAKKIILDLRENPGGLLHEAVNIVNLFVPRGQEVVSTKGKVEDWNKTYRTLNNPLDTEIPMVVLVSDGSASASEIVAGSLQDYDRAVLIGKKTFGKGLVQTTRPLTYNAQLKVTTAKYYIPSGRCIQALDYTHRKDDGTVARVADSLKREFTTRNGRKVYDGAGLDPDVEVEFDPLGRVTAALINSGLVFEFASRYCAYNPHMPDLKTFRLSENDYAQFSALLNEFKFVYDMPLEENAKHLAETARKERYYSELEGPLTTLRAKIETGKKSDLVRFKKEIMQVLEEQIAFHYTQNEGQALNALPRDKAVLEAQKLLNNPAAYQKILSPK
jgi:carboxyl-terminal processing protease